MLKTFIPILVLVLQTSFVYAMERFDIVTTEQLYRMIEDRQAGRSDFLLINTLDTLIYNHHSIPGSVNIPWSAIKDSPDLLAMDKKRPIVTYCMGYR